MIDGYGRNIHYLRLSVTELCNLRCRYCMPEEGVRKLPHACMLTEDEMVQSRVERVKMQPLYLHCMRHKDTARQDGTWEELVRLMHKYKARPNEPTDLETFVRKYTAGE